MGRLVATIIVGGLLMLTSRAARGSMIYQNLIQQHLGLTCAPACTICHDSPNGGFGTVHTPFGQALMMDFGLVASSPAALQRALDQDKAQHLDSDHDGDTDIEALIACRDPNQPDPGDAGSAAMPSMRNANTDPIPEYGCAMGRAPRWEDGSAVIGIGVLLAMRRRARR
jgi:hypothetical protein